MELLQHRNAQHDKSNVVFLDVRLGYSSFNVFIVSERDLEKERKRESCVRDKIGLFNSLVCTEKGFSIVMILS